jgi:hypothetical protein
MHASLFIFYVFCSTKSENRREEQVLPGKEGDWYQCGGGGGKRGRRVNMVQIMCTHICKCKNDIF